MDSSLGKGNYAEYRTQLLRRALDEKKKLGLDGSQVNVKPSSALQALRCYGLESNDSASFGDTEETVSSSRTNERRKIIDLNSKPTRAASPYRESQLSSDSFSSGDKRDRPLKSILKKAENPSDSPVSNKLPSPYGSAINTPFFLNNVENEDEYLYGKSIDEQSQRISTLYAKSKSKNKSKINMIDLNVQDSKMSMNIPSDKSKANMIDVSIQNSKSAKLFGDRKSSKTDLFAQDCKTSTKVSGISKNKSSVVDYRAQNSKVSSNLSGYAALLNFSKNGPKISQPKAKGATGSGSLQKDETSEEKKVNKPAVASNNNPTSNKLYSPNSLSDKKTTVAKSVSDKSNTPPLSRPNQVSVSKPIAKLLPRSVQKLQCRKPVDQSDDRKDASSKSIPQGLANKSVPQNSANELSKSSDITKKCDIKSVPKSVEVSLKSDELLLMKYVRRNRSSRRGKVEASPAPKHVTDGIANPVQKAGSTSTEKNKCSPVTVPVTSSIKNCDSESVISISPTVQRMGSSLGEKSKSGLDIEPKSSSMKSDINPLITTASPKRNATIETCKKESYSPNKKKEFLSRLSSINQKKKNFAFLQQGKRPLSKELFSKRPPRKSRGFFFRDKGRGRIMKGKEKYSNFSSEKLAYEGRDVRNQGAYKESPYSLSSEVNVYDRSRSPHSYDFTPENDVGDKSRDLSSKRSSSYKSFSHEAFDRNTNRYSFKSDPQRHSLHFSPSRNEFGNSPRRHSLDRSPGRYSFDGSPKRQSLDRSPSRHSFNESRGPRPFDRSPSGRSFSRSPGPRDYDRSPDLQDFERPEPHPYDRSPESHPYDGSPEPHPYDRSLEPHLYQRSPDSRSYDASPDSRQYDSPDPHPYDRSPVSFLYDRSPSPHQFDRSLDSHSYDRNSRLRSYDGSPGPESHSVNSGGHSQEMSPSRHSFGRRHRLYSFDNSPERLSGERGTGRRSIDRSPRRLSLDRSPRRHSNDRSSRQLSVDRSSERHSVELSPRRHSFDRQCRNNLSPERLRKSRIDTYRDSPGRISHRSPHQESRESLKHCPRSRSPEAVLFDACDKLSERSMKSNRSDLNPNLNTRAPSNYERLDLMNNPLVEGYNNVSMEKNLSPLSRISQSILERTGIPDVNKIVNAIDALASDYNKSIASEKTYITQGCSLQSFDTSLPVSCIQDPAQLTIPSTTYPATYEQTSYNQANNNLPFGYNSESAQASYPPYVSSADSFSTPYPTTYESQSTNVASLYPAASSTFHSTDVAPSSYSSSSAVFPPFSGASVQTPFSSTTVQAPFSNPNVQPQFSSTTVQVPFNSCNVQPPFSMVNTVPSSLNTTGLAEPPFSTADGLSEMFPASDLNYVAEDDSLERVSTLTNIPLQSDELSDKLDKKNSKKSQNSTSSIVTIKFITPEKIEKLLRQKSDIRKQMVSLNNEYEKLEKMQGDAMRRKRREKDGHKDMLLLEYSKLQSEIKGQLNNLINDVKNIEQELQNGFLGCVAEKKTKKECRASKGTNEKLSGKSDGSDEEIEESSNYEFYDSGSHWCKHCNKLCTTMTRMLEHLKSEEHLELTALIDKPWAFKSTSDKTTKNPQKGQKITKPVKGVQFIMPVDGFYCSLCKEYFEKSLHMEEHLKSSEHYEVYQNYTAENPAYEHRWLLDRLAGLPIVEIEQSEILSEEENHLQKKQKKDKQEKLRGKREEKDGNLRQEEDEKFRREKEHQFRQKEEKLRQMEEEKVDTKERLKRKEDKKKHNVGGAKGQGNEEEDNFKRRMEVVEKLNRRNQERENLKHSIEQREKMKQREEEEKRCRMMSCRKQEEEKLKRKNDEEREASNKKVRITDTSEENGISSGKMESTDVINDHPTEKKSKAKWEVYDSQKKMPFGKGNESKIKPKQTVVYIGRAPNFKSYNKGNSSFRANLLKLALQKKEADGNSKAGNEVTSAGSGISCVANMSSPANSSAHAPVTHRIENSKSAGEINISNPNSGVCTTDQQIVPTQILGQNEKNSNFEQKNCCGNISEMCGVNDASPTNNAKSLHKTSMTCTPTGQQNISASSNVGADFVQNFQSTLSGNCSSYENTAISVASTLSSIAPKCTEMYSNLNTDLGQSQVFASVTTFVNSSQMPSLNSPCFPAYNTQHMNVDISPSVPASSDRSNHVNYSNLSVKFCPEKSLQPKKSRRQAPVHGPLTEEDEDLVLLGINKEDRLPLVLPKPPPAALIRSNVNDDDKKAPDQVRCEESVPVTSDSDVSKIHSVAGAQDGTSIENINASYMPDTQSVSSIAQVVTNPNIASISQQNYGFMYDESRAQQQNANYSLNTQTNLAASCETVNCTNTSSMQHSYTYPYNLNVGNVTNFQGNFIMPNEQPNNTCSSFPVAQNSSVQQFQNQPSHMGYTYQRAAPPEGYIHNPRNLCFGGYPQHMYPPPNVNPRNYGPPEFRRGFGPRARMCKPSFQNKRRHRGKQIRPSMDDTEKGLPSPVKAEKLPIDNSTSVKSVPSETLGVEGCVDNSLSETTTLKGNAALTVSISQNEKSSSSQMLDQEPSEKNVTKLKDVKIFETVENTQKSLSGESGCDTSDCVELERGCTVIEKNKVPNQSLSADDLEVVNDHVNVYSTNLKRNSVYAVAEEITTENASSAVLGIPINNQGENSVNGTDIKAKQGVVKNGIDSSTVNHVQTRASIDLVPQVSVAIACSTVEGIRQQNQSVDNKSSESERHPVHSSVKTQENVYDTKNTEQHCLRMNTGNENSDTDEYDAGN